MNEETLVERLTRQDVMLTSINSNVAELTRRIDRQNGRVGVLEAWRWSTLGGVAVLTFLVGTGVVTSMALVALDK